MTDPAPPHIDNALQFIVEELRKGGRVSAPHHDMDLDRVIKNYWQAHPPAPANPLDERPIVPFYDAAYELCRRGILRRGRRIGLTNSGGLAPEDIYTLTEFGRGRIRDMAAQPQTPTTPDRYERAVAPHARRFGEGFAQRAREAASCYTTANYLACCAMCGAAAESVLLALAAAKFGGPGEAAKKYERSGGRQDLVGKIRGTHPGSLVDVFVNGMSLLSYWRDDAAHGRPSTIGEQQAFIALGQLLRLAQHCDDRWEALTAP